MAALVYLGYFSFRFVQWEEVKTVKTAIFIYVNAYTPYTVLPYYNLHSLSLTDTHTHTHLPVSCLALSGEPSQADSVGVSWIEAYINVQPNSMIHPGHRDARQPERGVQGPQQGRRNKQICIRIMGIFKL